MNLILLSKNDFLNGDGRVRVKGRQFKHIVEVHRAKAGDQLRVGLLNDRMGMGRIEEIHTTELEMTVQLFDFPPKPIPLTLILALPRPIYLNRIFMIISSLGVKEIHLIHSSRVEQTYWQSRVLDPDNVKRQFILGLEQAGDTVMPEVYFHKKFKPFVEDKLPGLISGKAAICAHPHTKNVFSASPKGPIVLIIGPEGGFVPYEVEKFAEAGCMIGHFGERILKVETAIPFLISKLV